MVSSLPETLVKTLARNLITNLAEKLAKIWVGTARRSFGEPTKEQGTLVENLREHKKS